jgi:hypothetical protein
MLANAVFVTYAEAGGKLEQLCHEIIAIKKTLYTFESDYNRSLIEMGAISVNLDDIKEIMNKHKK